MTINKIKISCDYLTVAFICTAIIICNDSRYVIAIMCTIFHELGHIAVMLRCGCDKIDIKINLFNIAISDKLRGIRSYSQDVAVICAGPLVNLIMMLIFGLANLVWKNDFFYNTSVISGMLCGFNLIPILSTDGGQLLEIALGIFFSPGTVRIIMNILTVIFVVPIGCLGFYVLLQSRYNYTLLFSAMYFVVLIIIRIVE